MQTLHVGTPGSKKSGERIRDGSATYLWGRAANIAGNERDLDTLGHLDMKSLEGDFSSEAKVIATQGRFPPILVAWKPF